MGFFRRPGRRQPSRADNRPEFGQAARALGNTSLDHLEFLAAFSNRFAASLDLDATLHNALEGMIEFLGAEAGALFLLESGGRELVCRASVGPADIEGLRLGADEGVAGRCVRRNQVEIVEDPYSDPGFHRPVDDASGFTTRSLLCAPLSVGDERIGAIEILNKRAGGTFGAPDIHLLQAMSSTAALAISNARLAGRLVEQERVRRELELAAEIQRGLLPRNDPGRLPIFGINRPIRQVSGDFFDFFPLAGGRIPFALGDVSGKGMNAALLMAKTASLFRCLAKSVDDPAAMLAIINREICETATRGMFVTMVAGTYEPWTGMLRFANAGHLPPLLRQTDRSYRTFPAESPPVGIQSDITFTSSEVDLDGGEFYVFSDGLTEYRFGDEELGVEGLIQMVEAASDEPLGERLRSLLDDLEETGWELRDDLTVLAIDGAWADESGACAPAPAPVRVEAGEPLLELRLPARADRMKLVRKSVRSAARMCGFDDDASEDIALAVNEACQNVILHAYGGSGDGDIELGLFRQKEGIMVRLRDFAPAIDAKDVKPRDLDKLRPGGLGTHFIREIMDAADFVPAPEGGGNVLEMVKRAR